MFCRNDKRIEIVIIVVKSTSFKELCNLKQFHAIGGRLLFCNIIFSFTITNDVH